MKYWDDINPFIKFGCLKDEKFYDKVKEAIVYKTTTNEYFTIDELGDTNAIHYTDDLVQQAQYINMYKDSDVKIVVLNGPLDNHFMSYIEYKNPGKVKFVRVDADVTETMKDSSGDITQETLDNISNALTDDFKKVSANDKIHVKAESMKTSIPAIVLLSEESRRMQEMAKMYGGLGFRMDDDVTIVLNAKNKSVQKLMELKANGSDQEKSELICEQIYDIAMLAHKPMDAENMTRFIERSAKILDMFSE